MGIKRTIRFLLTACCALCVVAPGVVIAYRLIQYRNASESAGSARALAEACIMTAPAVTGIASNAPETMAGEEAEGTQGMFIDLEALRLENPDAAGYLVVPDTGIAYPVVACEDPSGYLKTDFYGNPSVYGCIFADPESFRFGSNLVLYGHNMKDGAMFGSLDRYLDPGFADAHREILYLTDREERHYELCSVFTASAGDAVLTDDLIPYDAESMTRLSGYAAAHAAADHGGFAWGDSLITLATCEYSHRNGRLFVVGKLTTRKVKKDSAQQIR